MRTKHVSRQMARAALREHCINEVNRSTAFLQKKEKLSIWAHTKRIFSHRYHRQWTRRLRRAMAHAEMRRIWAERKPAVA